MEQTQQTPTQTIRQHCQSVWRKFEILHYALILDKFDLPWFKIKVPDWFDQYKKQILSQLLKRKTIEEYLLFHDCGKPLCRTIDENGKQHFPNHEIISYNTWMEIDGDEIIGNLILHDMDIHRIKADQVEEFIKIPNCVTLLIAGLAEINANAEMFGGIESTNFKIKFKQIERRGKQICRLLYEKEK